MKTKIANGKFMEAFGLSLQLLDPDFYAMGNYAHQVIREVHKVEDRIFDFFTVHRERNRQWKERRNAKAAADRTDSPLETRIWDVIAHPLDPIQDIADTTSRKGFIKRA